MFILGIAVLIGIAVFAVIMVNNAQSTSDEEALRATRDNVIRAVVSCYAYEGSYPDSIEYLEENYSLVVNKDKYLIYYQKIADNLMPSVVIEKWGSESE